MPARRGLCSEPPPPRALHTHAQTMPFSLSRALFGCFSLRTTPKHAMLAHRTRQAAEQEAKAARDREEAEERRQAALEKVRRDQAEARAAAQKRQAQEQAEVRGVVAWRWEQGTCTPEWSGQGVALEMLSRVAQGIRSAPPSTLERARQRTVRRFLWLMGGYFRVCVGGGGPCVAIMVIMRRNATHSGKLSLESGGRCGSGGGAAQAAQEGGARGAPGSGEGGKGGEGAATGGDRGGGGGNRGGGAEAAGVDEGEGVCQGTLFVMEGS